MFEKEAEEYVRKIRHDVINWGGKEPEERFYNEIKFKQAYLAGAEFGYNKVNEWHYVKDGNLLNTESLECLCIIRPDNEMLANKDFRGVLYFRSGRFYLDEDNYDCLKETNSDFTDIVIAWKEIVLPKKEY